MTSQEPANENLSGNACPVRWSGLLALHQSFSYPTRVTAAIKYCKYYDFIVDDSIIYREREPLGELAVISKNELVNAAEVRQAVDIRIK